jgi:hypothetical protein
MLNKLNNKKLSFCNFLPILVSLYRESLQSTKVVLYRMRFRNHPPVKYVEYPSKAGISKNYCATNSGSPEAELRFCPSLKLLKLFTY